MVHSLYRYEEYFKDKDRALALFDKIPFLNGGLFECLDKPGKEDSEKEIRIDGFSDNSKNKLYVPNLLFFSDKEIVDLNAAYGTRSKQYEVRGLIHILDTYKFTVTENTPIEEEVALDPELLGRAFENLLASYNPETGTTARKQTGSYYTPREIVNYITDETLIAYLKQKLIAHHESRNALAPTVPPAQLDLGGRAEPVQTQIDTQGTALSEDQNKRIEKNLRDLIAYNDTLHRFSKDESDALISAIDTIKILDPACGSGAFPMGVLHKLVFILGKLDPGNAQWKERQIEKASEIPDPTARDNAIEDIEAAFERNEFDYGRKLYLIENCIYGVDIQPIAVQIAKLRFFISLVVDQKIDRSRVNLGVRPLPNLETKFVASDALIGVEKPLQIQIRNPQVVRKERELSEVRRKHFTARTPKTKEKYRNLDADLRSELSDLLKRDGFPDDTTEKIAYWNPYDQNKCADWFDPEWMFNTRDGFDIVIGNPPYVQLQKNGGKLGRLYAPCDFDTFVRTGDIYCLFYEKANQLTRDGGHVCFITSDKWMRAGYGKKLRDHLIKHTRPIQLLDMGPDVFDATVDTNILLLQSVTPEIRATFKAMTIKSDFDKQAGNIAQYLDDNGMAIEIPAKGEQWVILSPEELGLKRKIEHIGKPLKDWNLKMFRGIVTGCNDAFVISEIKREELILQDPKSAEVIKPLLRGRDIRRYDAQWAGLYLLFLPWHFPLHEDPTISGASQEAEEKLKDCYPSIYNHLLQYQDRLRKRNRTETGIRYEWYALQRCANTYLREFEKEKIIYPNMTKFLPFVYDQDGYYTNDKAFIITGGKYLKYLTGYFNSKVAAKWIRENCPELQGGTRELRKVFIENISIPPVTESNEHLVAQIEERVNKILAAKRTNPDTDTTRLENEIDEIVYLLFDLTPEEIAIVEENTV